MSGASPSCSVVVLSYRDGPALPRLLGGLERELAAATTGYEIVVVDDGSGDGSLEVAQRLARDRPAIRVVAHPRNRGVGAAFRTGVETAGGAILGYIDGDGQYAPEDLPALLAGLGAGADAASGVRTRRADPWRRTLVSRVYRLVLRELYGLRLRDVNSGFKLYRREALARVEPLVSDGPFFDAEILIKLARASARIAEVPIRHLPRLHGRARGATPASIGRAFAGLVRDDMSGYLRATLRARCLRRLLLPLRDAAARAG